jgi:hypothetical protein
VNFPTAVVASLASQWSLLTLASWRQPKEPVQLTKWSPRPELLAPLAAGVTDVQFSGNSLTDAPASLATNTSWPFTTKVDGSSKP